jgi:hypothetical protein
MWKYGACQSTVTSNGGEDPSASDILWVCNIWRNSTPLHEKLSMGVRCCSRHWFSASSEGIHILRLDSCLRPPQGVGKFGNPPSSGLGDCGFKSHHSDSELWYTFHAYRVALELYYHVRNGTK